jgi:hypothetical protein
MLFTLAFPLIAGGQQAHAAVAIINLLTHYRFASTIISDLR